MDKKYKTGFIIGKFIPLHKGHQYLIESAIKQSEKLTLVICQNENNVIDPEIRAGWVRELYPEVDVRIYHHDSSLDSTSSDISPIWAKLVQNLLGFTPDAVFSSEEYGKTFAKCLGSAHVLVDLSREKFPISGTMVRENPYLHWQFLSEPVRAYYAKRIVCLGAESTGTTTLAKDLAKYYQTTWVPEYGRSYSEGKIPAQNQNWTSDEFVHIATTQNNLEESLARKSNKLLICDTDAFATRLWHERYMGSLLKDLDQITNTQNKSLYILTGDEIPFVQDGTRDGEHIRHQMHQRFIEELRKNSLPFITVTGNPKERLSKAISQIDQLFQTNTQETIQESPFTITSLEIRSAKQPRKISPFTPTQIGEDKILPGYIPLSMGK